MVLSAHERTELLARVTRHLAPRRVGRSVVAGAVDRVLAAMPNATAPPERAAPRVTVVVTATGLPDLASRLRAALPEALRGLPLEAATEGRHTVVVGQVDAGHAEAALEAAGRIGARGWTSVKGG